MAGVSEDKPEAWVTLAVDQIDQSVAIAGFEKTKEACRGHRDRVDTPYVKAFNMIDKDLGIKMGKWFKQCGIPTDDAEETVRAVGKELVKIFPEERTP